jgi:hypothetical protein
MSKNEEAFFTYCWSRMTMFCSNNKQAKRDTARFTFDMAAAAMSFINNYYQSLSNKQVLAS